MRQLADLNELYGRFSRGLLNRKDFEGLVYETLLDEGRFFNCFHWTRDEWIEFLSWFYHRLSKAIDSYRETGASFEAYVCTTVRWGIREYRVRRADNTVAEYAAWTVALPGMYACQTEPEYYGYESGGEEYGVSRAAVSSHGGADGERAAGQRKNCRQILLLILKCYYFVSDDFLEWAAPKTGMTKDELSTLVEKIRAIRLKRDEDMRGMRERMYGQFYRCTMYEQRLAILPENSAAAFKLKRRLEKARRRLAAMRERYAHMRPGASNRQVAEVVGLSKGTVDASLYSLKTRWNKGRDGIILN